MNRVLSVALALLWAGWGWGQAPPPQAEVLPPNYAGDNIQKIYKQLLVRPKGEFETTKQYMARADSVPTRMVSFRVEKGADGPWAKYNADAGQFTVSVLTNSLWGLKESPREDRLLVVKTSEKRVPSLGTDAFGASVKFTRVTEMQWGVIIVNMGSEVQLQFVFPADLGHAQRIKEDIALIVVCEVGPQTIPRPNPFYLLDDQGVGRTAAATFGVPTGCLTLKYRTERSTSCQYAIPAKVLEYWVFDSSSGQVLLRSPATKEPAQDDRWRR